jgi:predicted metal-binding membrane protein
MTHTSQGISPLRQRMIDDMRMRKLAPKTQAGYCLGFCWALMCVLFVAGAMNLVWVATLALFVFLEKIGPAGAVVARAAGMAMIVVGVLLFVRIH